MRFILWLGASLGSVNGLSSGPSSGSGYMPFGYAPSQIPTGAEMVFVIRHGERLDREDKSWSSKALRPQGCVVVRYVVGPM